MPQQGSVMAVDPGVTTASRVETVEFEMTGSLLDKVMSQNRQVYETDTKVVILNLPPPESRSVSRELDAAVENIRSYGFENLKRMIWKSWKS